MNATALRLAALGMAVFPARNEPGSRRHKSPCEGISWPRRSSAQRVTVEALWRLHPAAMPAIDCGKSGLLVIDLDRKPGHPDGVAAWEALAAGREISDCPIVQTPSGGRHLIFRQPARALGNGRGALPAGIDVRGAGGYVIGAGAPGYRLVQGGLGAIPEAPHWLLAILRERGREPGERPRAAGKPAWSSTPGGSERIRSALEHVPAWDYDTWHRVGMALQNELGDGGFDMWRTWSLTAPGKWHERLARRHWLTFGRRDGITIRTVFWMARQHGWRDRWWHEDAARDRWAAQLAAGLLKGRESEIETLRRLCPDWRSPFDPTAELLAHVARREIEAVADMRHGWAMPDAPAGRTMLKCLLVLTTRAWMARRDTRIHEGWDCARADRELRSRLGSALAELLARTPWQTRAAFKRLAGNAARCADDACVFGEDIELLAVEREAACAWHLWTIDEVVERRSDARKRRRRRAGMQSREAYRTAAIVATSARQTRPWEALGISRATYYRHQSAVGGT